MKKYITFFFCLFPSKMTNLLLKMIGHKVSWKAKIGFSFIFVDYLELQKNTKIGHFNFIKMNKIKFKEKAYIGHFNFIKGPISFEFEEQGAIGNLNNITRASLGITYGKSTLKMGELSKITSRHIIDLTKSIYIAEFSTIAGSNSQIWTHGYVHAAKGAYRVRVDGEVHIENNVYIGSNCVINAGVKISKEITIGSNSTVSKNLTKPGMYVSQKLRFLEKNINNIIENLQKVDEPNLIEDVYKK